MKKIFALVFVLVTVCSTFGQVTKCESSTDISPMKTVQNKNQTMWKQKFKEMLPLLGHRNWILIVDKAFPLQSAAGMTYLDSQDQITNVLDEVLVEIKNASHVKPIIYTDKELQFIAQLGQKEALMCDDLKTALKRYEVNSILHDEVFTKIDAASKLFNVLVIKTESDVAYSSVFIELDCGYWSAEKEEKLRKLMNNE